MYVDNDGDNPWLIVAGVVAFVGAVGLDHYLAKHHPDGLVLYSKGTKGEGLYEEFLFISGEGFKCDQNGFTLLNLKGGIYRETSYFKGGEISFLGLGIFDLKAKADWSDRLSVDIGGHATIYEMSGAFSFDLGKATINIPWAVYIGSISFSATFDLFDVSIKFSPPTTGIGGSIGFDIDIN